MARNVEFINEISMTISLRESISLKLHLQAQENTVLSVLFYINTLNSILALLDVQRVSERFSSYGISVVFKWNISSVQIYYQQPLFELQY